jgi:hypothetical protein
VDYGRALIPTKILTIVMNGTVLCGVPVTVRRIHALVINIL